jgi:hypothetical protein
MRGHFVKHARISIRALPGKNGCQHLDRIPLICAGSEQAGSIGRLSQSERFHWLVSPRSTIIQTSPVHSGLCSDPENTLERLFKEMVLVE